MREEYMHVLQKICTHRYIYNIKISKLKEMDSPTQVKYIHSASNLHLKFFLCATTLHKWHVDETATYCY